MRNVSTMMGLISQLESSFVTVHQERCVLVRNRNAECLRCAEACTSGCIGYDGERLSVSPEKCIGCGTCATACPTCALEAHHPNDAELANRCLSALGATGGVACIACARFLQRAQGRYDEDKVVSVECLGRVEESLLTVLAAQGASDTVLVRGACEACEHVRGWQMAQQVCDTENQLLQAWGSSGRVRIAQKLPSALRAADAGYDKGRRASFEQGRLEAVRFGAAVAGQALCDTLGDRPEPDCSPRYVKVMDDGTLPHFVPDRRERLLDALASMGDPLDVMVDTRLWGHVVIDTDRCTSCQMCAAFCPTGALAKFEDAEGAFGVEHYPGDCVKCRCCTVICPADALELSEEVFAVDMLAGMTDRYEMQPPSIERGRAHTIWNVAKTMTKTDQVYER